MGLKVIFAPQAIDRLSAIVQFIAKDNPTAAERFGTRLLDYAEMLTDFPRLGAPYPKRKDVRRLTCRPYFIYYRIKQQQEVVEILEFWHSARRDPEL